MVSNYALSGRSECLPFITVRWLCAALLVPMFTVSRHHPDITMIIFVTIIIGRCREGSVRRRSWLALAGIGLVVASGVAAYGANSAFGKFNPREGVGSSRARVPNRSAPILCASVELENSQDLSLFGI